ncbi:peptide ABC transporter permease [Spirochaetia bacterium]|nr:peptide ABC transporter permease [Spirochaetia bacterium]
MQYMSIDAWFEKLDESEKAQETTSFSGESFLRSAVRRFYKNKLAVFGLVSLAAIILLALFVPIFSRYSFDTQDITSRNQMPSGTHWFGTDKFGRDMFVRVWCGARISLMVGFVSTLINLIIGVVYGGISGFMGGKTDLLMMRLTDIIASIPSLIYVILIMLVFGSNINSILIGICISSWIGMARIVRSETLRLKQQEFCLAAKVMGASSARILFKNILVNAIGPIIVNVTMMVPQAIFTEAFLSFVGVGISAPMASWGTLAQDARTQIELFPLQIVFPLLAICITIFALNFVGDGLGKALDPKNRKE